MATFVTADGTQLYYERRGAGRRVYALCGGPADDFRYLADDLAPLVGECELVFHDYRGSGRSASAPPETYTMEKLADDLDELRTALGDDKIVVIGHSMGGFVALNYALRHAAHCERIVLVGAFPCAIPRKMMGPTFRAVGLGAHDEDGRPRDLVAAGVQLAAGIGGAPGAPVRGVGDLAGRSPRGAGARDGA